MENSVLGNALEGVPEEDEEEGKPKDPNIESAENLDGEQTGRHPGPSTAAGCNSALLLVIREDQRRAEGSGVRRHGGEGGREGGQGCRGG